MFYIALIYAVRLKLKLGVMCKSGGIRVMSLITVQSHCDSNKKSCLGQRHIVEKHGHILQLSYLILIWALGWAAGMPAIQGQCHPPSTTSAGANLPDPLTAHRSATLLIAGICSDISGPWCILSRICRHECTVNSLAFCTFPGHTTKVVQSRLSIKVNKSSS